MNLPSPLQQESLQGMLHNAYLQQTGLNQYLGLGGQLGQHWNPAATHQGNSSNQSYLANLGAQNIAPLQAAHLAQRQAQINSYPVRPIEDAGFVAGEIVAHRVWKICPGGYLRSVTQNSVWAPNEPMHGEINYRGMDFQVGVHAFKSQRDAFEEYGLSGYDPRAVGKVLLWGDVVEHEKGWRAEYGRVHSIDHLCNVPWWREGWVLRRIRNRYSLGKSNDRLELVADETGGTTDTDVGGDAACRLLPAPK